MTPEARPELTKIEVDVLRVFHERAAANVAPPTLREIARHFGWASPTAARKHVEALERKGVLAIHRGIARGASFATPWGAVVPMIERIGTPAPTTVAVPKYLLPPEGASFAFQQSTAELQAYGIYEGDLVVVGPRECPSMPRLVVVARKGTPVAIRPEHERTKKRYGVVVAVLRAYVADSLR